MMPHAGQLHDKAGLHDKLENSIQLAVSKKRLNAPGMDDRSLFEKLHQVLTGPAGSGKTYQATRYAGALAAEGLTSKDAGHLTIDCSHLRDTLARSLVVDRLRKLDRGVVIVDEIDKLDDVMGPLLAGALVERMDAGKIVVILTGPEGATDKFLQDNPELAARLPQPLSLTKPPTAEELAEMKRQNIISEWQGMKTIAVQVGKPVKAPGTARFRKKDPAQTS